MARENVKKVFEAWMQRRPAKGDSKGTISTDGTTVFSYSLPIAKRVAPYHYEIIEGEGQSATTSSQIRALGLLLKIDPRTDMQHLRTAGRVGGSLLSGRDVEIAEMGGLLARRGYDPSAAVRLRDEGMGPEELLHILKTTRPGEMGSLEYTHGIRSRRSR